METFYFNLHFCSGRKECPGQKGVWKPTGQRRAIPRPSFVALHLSERLVVRPRKRLRRSGGSRDWWPSRAAGQVPREKHSAISCQQSAVSNQPQLVFVNLPLLRIFDGPGKARFEPFGAVGRGEDGGAAFEDTANTTTPRPAARQVSGPGFSRAVKAQKKLFLAAAGPRAAQRSALEERRG
jgi:hypothetical protein